MTGTLEQKLDQVSKRISGKVVAITEPAPQYRYDPHPCREEKHERVLKFENALLWQMVEAYEHALRFHGHGEGGCPVALQALEHGVACRKKIRARAGVT